MLIYGRRMLALTIIATIVAAVAAFAAWRSAEHARSSLAQAKRSADAAEKAAGAAAITAAADRAEDHRARTPRLTVSVDSPAVHDGTDYRIRNEGPADLDSVVVHRPIVETGVMHPVARTGDEYGEEARLGPMPMGASDRFTLSLGSGVTLPEFRVKIVSRAGDEEWATVVLLDKARRPPPPRVVVR